MPILAVLALIVVPLLEIYVIVRVGQWIGGWQTIGLLVIESLLGALLLKREGRRAWRALRAAVEQGRLPGRQLADAALVLIGGTLLLTPGFLTDVVGFVCVLPVTRPLARRLLNQLVTNRVLAPMFGVPTTGRDPRRDSGPAESSVGSPPPRVVPGEVIGVDAPDESTDGDDHGKGSNGSEVSEPRSRR